MKYSYILHTPNGNITIADQVNPFSAAEPQKIVMAPYTFQISGQEKNGCCLTEITVSAEIEAEVYLSVYGEGDADLYSFAKLCEVERIFRQSPHDPDNYHFKMEKSAVPMVAAVKDGKGEFIISDNPSYFDNATTQHIIPEQKCFYVSSGDKGGAPNYPISDEFGPIYHKINAGTAHTLRFVAAKATAGSLSAVRREGYRIIEKVFGTGSDSLYRAMCFAANYMHIRINERGTSNKWIVAGIEYGNSQYVRDAFWQSWILDEEIEAESYRALVFGEGKLGIAAEYPLVHLIWTYRLFKNGRSFDRENAKLALQGIFECMDKYSDGGYYANSLREMGAFRNWFDMCAFEKDDLDAYNQSLLICALEAAKRLGFEIGDRKERAIEHYHKLFNGKYFQLSDKKKYMCLDFTVGEVIHYVLFGELFIDQKAFETTYRRIVDGPAKTPYGIKIISTEDGGLPTLDAFAAYGQVFEEVKTHEPGRYHLGGSWHLYEILFHIAGYLHGMPDAEQNMIERVLIDLNIGGSTYEYNHTVTGEGMKANQGWNAAIYAVWEELIARGEASPAFFEAVDAKLESFE